MATITQMMYTVLPNGGPSTAYEFSIYVSPRLTGSGATGRLQDWALGNWTQKLRGSLASSPVLAVEIGAAGGPQLKAQVRPECVAGLDPALWDKVFPAAQTQVTARVFQDHSKRWMRSYPVKPLEAYIDALYNEIANEYPDAFPDLKGTTPITELVEHMGRVKTVIDRALPGPRYKDGPKQYQPVPSRGRATHPDRQTELELTQLATSLNTPHIPFAAFFQAIRFFKRGNQTPYRSADSPYDPTLVPDRPKEPLFDFHQALAALGDHPYLLRRLGLILDCVLEPGAAAVLGASNKLQLLAPSLLPITALTPWTQYLVDAASGFRPQPRPNSDIRHGLLRLDDPNVYQVIQTDPDGNAIKVYDYAVNMHRHRNTLLAQKAANPHARSSQAPEETSLPALRSGGLMVIRSARDDKLWDATARQAEFEANPEAAVLYADDVLRGYRVDVNYRGAWFSLCRRSGRYEVAGQVIAPGGPDEGYMKAESASSDPEPVPQGQQQPDLYVHETLLAWRNFSLVAAVPGKTIVPVPQADKRQIDKTDIPKNAPGAGFQVTTHFVAEAYSLPPLRYGEKYVFRARAVDIAGNGVPAPPSVNYPTALPEQPAPGVGESQSIVYRRHDPVPAPMLVVTKPFVEGESMERLVIRSRGDASPEPLPAPLGIDEGVTFQQANRRWVAAPKAHVGEIEAHGMFDALFKQSPDVSRDLLKKEAGSFDDLVNLETGNPADPNRATIVDITGAEVNPASLPAGWKKGDPLPDGQYYIHKESPVKLPYLPDPLAHGVAFMPHDGSSAVLHRKFGTGAGWHDSAPFALVLRPGATTALGMGTEVTAQLPKGHMLSVRYATAIVEPDAGSEGELTLMARWHGMSAAGRDNTKAHGFQHWMLTPFRTMVLVHAVEKPVRPARFATLSASKGLGKTFAMLRGLADLHTESTGELELRGRWRDFMDDPASDRDPYTIDKDGHVADQRVDYGEALPVQVPQQKDSTLTHEFGDTKHRWLYYHLVGTTRYREYFPHKLTNYEELVPHPTYPQIIQKRKLISVDGPEYLTSDSEPIDIRSSARPDAPQPLYVVPTFQWKDTPTGRQRLGRGLRIYLNRGWFSSGEDELLGIVLFPLNPSPSALAEYREYVTQWGSDPLFDKAASSAFLSAAHFVSDPAQPQTAVRAVADGLILAETFGPGKSNLPVRVLGFQPLWDAERKLWYVDVVLGPASAYYTFVRFALCRYQPHSLANVELSRVVRTEFAQLLADRSATLSYAADHIDVTLHGPSALSKLGKALNGNNPQFSQAGPASLETLADDPPVVGPTLNPNPAAGSAHQIVARLEWRPVGSHGDLGWEGVDNGIDLASYTSLLSTNVYWKGSVRWPRRDLPTNREYRLALYEYEVWQTDYDVAENNVTTSAAVVPMRRRLVYADFWSLDVGPIISGG
jgi:hypothetical protein